MHHVSVSNIVQLGIRIKVHALDRIQPGFLLRKKKGRVSFDHQKGHAKDHGACVDKRHVGHKFLGYSGDMSETERWEMAGSNSQTPYIFPQNSAQEQRLLSLL